MKPIEFRADLHCHSTCSDGTFSPRALVEHACSLHLQGLSITDHDTLAAYPEAINIAEAMNLPLIPGLELSADHRGKSIHILAYSFPLDSPPLQTFCLNHHKRRRLRLEKMIELLVNEGFDLCYNEIIARCSTSSPGRPHIAEAMLAKGYITTISQAFHDYLGEGKRCYVPGYPCSVEETLDIIHQAKGLAIIAHPHLIKETKIIKELLEMPFDGIEGYYARFPSDACERWIKMGFHRGWIITGGSDFHGAMKPNLPLGSSWVNEETFRILQQHFLQHSASSPS